ncbi:MAG: hypothetical protein O3C40_27740, partial [Planctomycetota bacterium]|nr:hypothetical protein [Planctomycetota bacterium]
CLCSKAGAPALEHKHPPESLDLASLPGRLRRNQISYQSAFDELPHCLMKLGFAWVPPLKSVHEALGLVAAVGIYIAF